MGHVSCYPSYFAPDQVTTSCPHLNPPQRPLGWLIHGQAALLPPVIQCFLSAHPSPSTLGCALLGLGDCKHTFAGSLPAGFLLPMEDSEEQKVGGRKQFLASGSDGVMIIGNCDNGNGDQRAQPWRRAVKPGSQSLAASDLSKSASAFRLLTSLLLFLQSCQKLLEPTP